MTTKRRVSCGLEVSHVPDLQTCIATSAEAKYDFVVVPIVHPRLEREFHPAKPASSRGGPLTRSDLLLASSDWSSVVVGRLSPSIDVDSKISHVRKRSVAQLEQELRYCSHLGLPAVTLALHSCDQPNLARISSNFLLKGASFQLWVQLPLVAPWPQMFEAESEVGEPEDTWQWWNRFRMLSNSSSKVSLSLTLTEEVPPESCLLRWAGEPIKTLRIPANLFLTNKKGYPVLSRTHQAVVKRFHHLDIQIIVTGLGLGDRLSCYQQYLDHLYQQCPLGDPLQQFARGYEDYLQCPLQPLMDNLESQTYEVFEKDPVKYSEYQAAIQAALTDLVPEEEVSAMSPLVVTVVGAGRGPLVRAALNASQLTGRKIRVFAIEKNPNAVVTLQQHQLEVWGDQVTVVSTDMRDWNPPGGTADHADILVSELLGSFGDNELSPECLDGAQKFLKPGGISIPCSYTSYLGPLQSSKLYNEVRACKDETKHPLANFETPYVVHFQNRFELSPPQPLFTFKHPNLSPCIDNSRYAELSFDICSDSLLHGFGGYFECQLYKEIMISILPSTHSPGMFSWFPILFPLREPVQLKKQDKVVLHFWRNVSSKHVWYEWSLSEPCVVSTHNPNGRSYEIGL